MLMTRLDFHEAKQSVIQVRFNDSLVKEIANLKIAKDWKYGVGEQVLDAVNMDVLKTYLSLPDPRDVAFNQDTRKDIEDIISDYCFKHFDFGTKKNIGSGNNRVLQIKGGDLVTEETFQYPGRRSYTGSYRYSDYALIFHRTKAMLMYRLPWMKKPATVDMRLCHGNLGRKKVAEIKYQLTGETEYMVHVENQIWLHRVSGFVFPGSSITWYEKEKAFIHPEYGEYHVSDLWEHSQDVKRKKRVILNSFQERKQMAERNKELLEKAAQVTVSFQDSIDAGNCEIETRRFAEKVKQREKLEGDIHEIEYPGDQLLKLRNDAHAKNAVMKAIEKKMGNTVA